MYKTITTVAGIASVTIMEIVAMIYMHIDGAVLSTCVAAIVGLVAYQYGKEVATKKGKS